MAGYGHAIVDSEAEDSDNDTEYAGPLKATTCTKMRVPKAFLLPSCFRRMVEAGSQWLGECSAEKDEKAKNSRLLTLPIEVRAIVFKWLFMDAEILNPSAEYGQREGYEGWVICDEGKMNDLVSILNTCNTFHREGFPLFWKYASMIIPDPSRALFTMMLPPPHWYVFIERWTQWPLYLLSEMNYEYLPRLRYFELRAFRSYTWADAVSTNPTARDLVEHERTHGRDVLSRSFFDGPFDDTTWKCLQHHLGRMPEIDFVLRWLLHEPYHGPLQEGKVWDSTYATVSSFQPQEQDASTNARSTAALHKFENECDRGKRRI